MLQLGTSHITGWNWTKIAHANRNFGGLTLITQQSGDRNFDLGATSGRRYTYKILVIMYIRYTIDQLLSAWAADQHLLTAPPAKQSKWFDISPSHGVRARLFARGMRPKSCRANVAWPFFMRSVAIVHVEWLGINRMIDGWGDMYTGLMEWSSLQLDIRRVHGNHDNTSAFKACI